jgi:hypothetical protein
MVDAARTLAALRRWLPGVWPRLYPAVAASLRVWTTYTWEDADAAKTRMTLRNRGEPSGFATVAGPLMGRAMRRANRKDLARLKRVLEGYR